MNDRLEIAARILAGWSADGEDVHIMAALDVADRLIAQELASRPKCEHLNRIRAIGDLTSQCQDCGAEVKP